ncbi:hypothetical protein H4582DRAFT_1200343 [Lactarius indigo]|nr:hypothetical protein H4582DRAFT_1200343 [Lactarius indigo]
MLTQTSDQEVVLRQRANRPSGRRDATSGRNIFAQLGECGTGVLSSSGDYGVGTAVISFLGGTTQAQVQVVRHITILLGPWLSDVGGTTGYNPEIVASASVGGFSKAVASPTSLRRRSLTSGKPPLETLNSWLHGSGLAGLNDVISISKPG